MLNSLARASSISKSKEDDHQLLLGALNVLAIGGSLEAIPYLQIKINEWEKRKIIDAPIEPSAGANIYYSVLKIKATQAISQIQERLKNLSEK